MLRGHLDLVSPTGVRGWAADDENPDRGVEVSIFVDDAKIAQIACVDPRPDLRHVGIYGAGEHGLTFEFPTPLSSDSDTKVSVRFTSSGILVPPGEILVASGRSTPLRAIFPEEEGELRFLPIPSKPRDLFELLSLYRGDRGLYQLLSRVPFEAEAARQIYYTVFGEMPEAPTKCRFGGTYSPRDDLYEHIMSREFQRDVISIFLRAYSEKRRLIFVHIPKCAGTDLTAHFKQRYPSLDRSITDRSWTSAADMIRRLGQAASYMQLCDSIFVSGHTRLAHYTKKRLIRPVDRVFTVVRDPIEIALSQVNYVLTRLVADSETGEVGPDTRGWLQTLNMEMPRTKISNELARDISTRILYQREIVVKDCMCTWLGEGDAQSALEMLVTNDVEVSDTERYNMWLNERWNIRAATRMNKSISFVQFESLEHQDIEYIRDLTKEDMKLYATVRAALTATERSSVTGADLARVCLEVEGR